MNNCGLTCVLFIWISFLWPIIVTSFYLIIKRKQITTKGKYFLLSTISGYALLIGLNFLISFLARNFLEPNEIGMRALAIGTTIVLFIPPVIFSHVLSKKIANKTQEPI